MKRNVVLIAPDSFKGSLSSIQVSDAIELGLSKVMKKYKFIKVPLADGGEGTTRVIVDNCGGEIKKRKCIGPIGQLVNIEYGLINNETTVVIEAASCCGLDMVNRDIRTPMITSSRALGELIYKLLNDGYKKFIIGLGGTGTNDGGIGMLSELGAKFTNIKGEDINPIGGELINIKTINFDNLDSRLFKSSFTVLSDVNNTIVGENGASCTFAEQKGANNNEIALLEKGMQNYVEILKRDCKIDVVDILGGGAAGGLGCAFHIIGGKIQSGIESVLEMSHFDSKIEECEFVITGEGSIDNQTINGKTIEGVSKRAKRNKKPVIALAGCVSEQIDQLYEIGVTSIFSIIDRPKSIEVALDDGYQSLVKISENLGRLIITLKDGE